METLPMGYTLELPEGVFPLSTDSMALAHFCKLPKNAAVLDLGSGGGTLGTLLCAGHPDCRVTGIERDPLSHQVAETNILRNNLGSRMTSICADIAQVPSLFAPGFFSCCVSNPPYFSGGPAGKTLPYARQRAYCSLEALMTSAAWALKYGGDFFLVHPPGSLGEIISAAAAAGLEAKRLCLLRHRENGPVALILLQLRKGAKPGLLWEEISLFTNAGAPTKEYRKIYHMEDV